MLAAIAPNPGVNLGLRELRLQESRRPQIPLLFLTGVRDGGTYVVLSDQREGRHTAVCSATMKGWQQLLPRLHKRLFGKVTAASIRSCRNPLTERSPYLPPLLPPLGLLFLVLLLRLSLFADRLNFAAF